MYLDLPIVKVAEFGPLDDWGGGVGPLKTSLVIISNAFEVALSQVVYSIDLKVLANPKSCARPESHLYQLFRPVITYLVLFLPEYHPLVACVCIFKIRLHYGLDVGPPTCLHGLCLCPIVLSEISRCTFPSWGSYTYVTVNASVGSVICGLI
jgi:hypothetical protein